MWVNPFLPPHFYRVCQWVSVCLSVLDNVSWAPLPASGAILEGKAPRGGCPNALVQPFLGACWVLAAGAAALCHGITLPWGSSPKNQPAVGAQHS